MYVCMYGIMYGIMYVYIYSQLDHINRRHSLHYKIMWVAYS